MYGITCLFSTLQVALILMGETVLSPVFVYLVFGLIPSSYTMAGGGLLLATLVRPTARV